MKSKNQTAFRISVIYLLIGGLWILLSDHFLAAYTTDASSFLIKMQTFKGWFYVSITALILYWLIDRDVRTIRNSETALQENQRFLMTLLGNLPGMVYRCRNDNHWTMEFVSDGCFTLTGYTASDFINNSRISYQEIIYPDDREIINEEVQKALQNKENFKLQYRIICADGSEKWVWEQGCGVFSENGSVDWIEGFITDISAQKNWEIKIKEVNEELEQRVKNRTTQLESINKELEAFSYSVSHDLRAPLRAIDGFSRILLEDHAAPLDEEGKRLLGIIRSNTKKMGNLIDDLLSFSRMGRKPLVYKRIQIQPIIYSILEELKPAYENRIIRFEIGELPDIFGDPVTINQVFENLLSNAIKFTRHQSDAVIKIGGEIRDCEILYYVKDNGAGFDMKYVDKLFSVFQRLHREEEFEGTGVGLAIVKRIVHRHNGKIWAEAAVNKGASFYFTLPLNGNPA